MGFGWAHSLREGGRNRSEATNVYGVNCKDADGRCLCMGVASSYSSVENILCRLYGGHVRTLIASLIRLSGFSLQFKKD